MKHTQTGFAILVTKHPKWKNLPRFGMIGKTVLVRPRKECRNWLRNLKNGMYGKGAIDGKVVPVTVEMRVKI